MAFPYSAWRDHAPEQGFGGIRQSKHLNIQENPDTGKMYFIGGDYSGNDGDNIGVWAWYPPTNSWEHERSNCGVQGEVMPGQPNESGFQWDPSRKKFWLLP